eukprot:GGOE01043512.1.p1 GENE.GGOE01043512.1~~GGOE01043512.1.p1  ORF type:complete len:609 (+),score=104.72 GGOE01043512.1:121-1827(+)
MDSLSLPASPLPPHMVAWMRLRVQGGGQPLGLPAGDLESSTPAQRRQDVLLKHLWHCLPKLTVQGTEGNAIQAVLDRGRFMWFCALLLRRTAAAAAPEEFMARCEADWQAVSHGQLYATETAIREYLLQLAKVLTCHGNPEEEAAFLAALYEYVRAPAVAQREADSLLQPSPITVTAAGLSDPHTAAHHQLHVAGPSEPEQPEEQAKQAPPDRRLAHPAGARRMRSALRCSRSAISLDNLAEELLREELQLADDTDLDWGAVRCPAVGVDPTFSDLARFLATSGAFPQPMQSTPAAVDTMPSSPLCCCAEPLWQAATATARPHRAPRVACAKRYGTCRSPLPNEPPVRPLAVEGTQFCNGPAQPPSTCPGTPVARYPLSRSASSLASVSSHPKWDRSPHRGPSQTRPGAEHPRQAGYRMGRPTPRRCQSACHGGHPVSIPTNANAALTVTGTNTAPRPTSPTWLRKSPPSSLPAAWGEGTRMQDHMQPSNGSPLDNILRGSQQACSVVSVALTITGSGAEPHPAPSTPPLGRRQASHGAHRPRSALVERTLRLQDWARQLAMSSPAAD